jgi:hypothetical protein
MIPKIPSMQFGQIRDFRGLWKVVGPPCLAPPVVPFAFCPRSFCLALPLLSLDGAVSLLRLLLYPLTVLHTWAPCCFRSSFCARLAHKFHPAHFLPFNHSPDVDSGGLEVAENFRVCSPCVLLLVSRLARTLWPLPTREPPHQHWHPPCPQTKKLRKL